MAIGTISNTVKRIDFTLGSTESWSYVNVPSNAVIIAVIAGDSSTYLNNVLKYEWTRANPTQVWVVPRDSAYYGKTGYVLYY